jgi:O-antigen/teichoic acid export membrane protein
MEPGPGSGRAAARPLRARLYRAAAATFAMRIAAVALGFLASVAMARLLGVAAFGVYALVIAWATLLTTPAMLGFERLLVRELATLEVRDDWPRIRGILRLAERVVLSLAIAMALLLAVVGLVVGDRDGLGVPAAFAVGALIVPLTAMLNLRQSALQGLHHVAVSFVPESIVRPGMLLLLAGATLLVTASGRPPAVVGVALMVVATAAALAVALLLLRRYLGARRSGDAIHPQAWLTPALPLAYLATVGVVTAQIDLVLVGLLGRPADAGAYAVAVRGSLIVAIVASVINSTSAPTFARLWSKGDRVGLQRQLTLAVRSSLVASLVIAAPFVLFGSAFLGLFGPGFDQAVVPLTILTIGRVLGAAAGPTGTLLTMTGEERSAAFGATAGAVLEAVLVVILLPWLGLVGAAIGSSAAIIVVNLIQAWVVRRRLGLRATALGI